MDKDQDAGSGVIARAAAVLKVLESLPQGASLGQIAKLAGLPRTTVHRLVGALEAQGFVTSSSTGVRLGAALARLAAAAHTDILALARPCLEALGRRTRETVDLCVLRGAHCVSVDQYASDQELRVVSAVGTAFPVHCTAHGKALLAGLTRDERRALLPAKRLERRTANTLTSLTQLEANLLQASAPYLDAEEHALGVCGLGVALDTGSTERYAIALAVPALRFAEHRAALEAALLQTQAEIQAALGRPAATF